MSLNAQTPSLYREEMPSLHREEMPELRHVTAPRLPLASAYWPAVAGSGIRETTIGAGTAGGSRARPGGAHAAVLPRPAA